MKYSVSVSTEMQVLGYSGSVSLKKKYEKIVLHYCICAVLTRYTVARYLESAQKTFRKYSETTYRQSVPP